MSNYNQLLLDLQYHFAKRIQKEANKSQSIWNKIEKAESDTIRDFWIQENLRHLGRLQALRSVYDDLGEFIENPDALEEHGNFQ